MPPINQEGSRAGLYTALVVFVILFVVSSVLSFQFYGKFTDKTKEFEDFKKQYHDVALPGSAQTPPISDWLAARAEVPARLGITTGDTAVDVARKELLGLSEAITGTQSQLSPAAIADHATATLKDNQAMLTKAGASVTLPTAGLEEAVSKLSTALADRQKSVSSLTAELRDTNAKLTATISDTAKLNAQHDEEMKKQQAASDAAIATAQAAATANTAAMTQMQTDQKASGEKNIADNQQSVTDLATANQQITKLTAQVNSDKVRFAARRADVINPIIRQVDAKIIRVPNNEVCYINLGYGDQVTAGLTFEVYDKAEGVPPIPPNVTGDEELPVGKASIEITHVGTTSSECRIVKLAPGAVLSEGDVIENLVYDPHTKYNFFVYGNFDLAGNGRPNAPDADVMKRLVTQWGGKLTDQVNVDTDFVVLGAEPVLPNFSKDDLTAENQDKLAKAQDALNKYQEIANEAKELHIPILNQNRFLYYVGFYDQAKR